MELSFTVIFSRSLDVAMVEMELGDLKANSITMSYPVNVTRVELSIAISIWPFSKRSDSTTKSR